MNTLIFSIKHLDVESKMIRREQLLHLQQLKLILENVWQFQTKLMLRFFLMESQVLKCIKPIMEQHLHQQLIKLIQQYVLKYKIKPKQLLLLLMGQILLDKLLKHLRQRSLLQLWLKFMNAWQLLLIQKLLLFYKIYFIHLKT